MKKQKVQEESNDKEEDKKKKDFGEDFKQAWYERSMKILQRNIFQINRVILKEN